MNLPATLPNLPAHLQKLASNTALMGVNHNAAAGINFGGWPVLSIKGGKFRLVQTDGTELLVPTHHVDVIIIATNPNGVSKRYYDTKWDPNTPAGVAPACYSDNGVAPSSKAAKPQCSTCAMCPMNAWGSKISEASGKATKACSDLKKLAVFVADNTDGPVFELDVPADSLKNFATYVSALDKHGIPVSLITTRVSFDTTVSHPKLIFTPVVDKATGQLPYITAEQAEAIESVIGTDEVDNCTGKNDKPFTGAIAALPAPVAAPVAAVAPPPMPPLPTQMAPPPLPPAPVQMVSPPVAPVAAPATPPVPPTVGTPPTAPLAGWSPPRASSARTPTPPARSRCLTPAG